MRKADIGLVEAVAAIVIQDRIVGWVKTAAAAAGAALPVMPVLKFTYISFGFSLFILLWVKLRGETWASFGLVVPAKWGRIIGYGLLLFAAQMAFGIFAQQPVEQAVASFTGSGPNKASDVLGEVTGNLPLLLYLLPFVWLFAAFGEEFFFRGYLMNRFAQFMGEGKLAWTFALIAQAILFGAAHAYQGAPGMVSVAIGGLILGAGTLIWGRNLWPAIIGHGLADTLGFTLLYWGRLGH